MGSSKPVEWTDRLAKRFFSKAVEIDGCWVWIAFKDRKGYGRFQYGVRDARLAYNVSYGLMVGEVPAGLELDHTCRNKACINPYHLEPVTPRINMLRRWELTTSCPSGHPYDTQNTYFTPQGNRVCRTCRKCSQRVVKEREKVARAARGHRKPGPPTATHCKRGHPFDEVNTYVVPGKGIRRCRTCHADRERRRRPKQTPGT